MSVPKLEVRGLQAGYGDVQVLWDVSFEVGPGETVCVVGSNGAGKTTALRCISGLLPARAGAVRVDGADLTNAAPAALLDAGIAHVPEGRRLFAAMSVRDNLLMGAYRRKDRDQVAADLEHVLSLFPRLKERLTTLGGSLSGGEQQMCAIARGLMARPSLLMIDELSLGLAPRAVELLTDALVDIRRTGLAVLLVEQDVMAALDIADRAVVIDRGRVTAAGPAKDLAGDPSIREAYMGIV